MFRFLSRLLLLALLMFALLGGNKELTLTFPPQTIQPAQAALLNVEYDQFLYLPVIYKDWRGAWIAGRVIDASEEKIPLEGVQLCTPDHECAVSNANGEYVINLTSAGWKQVTAEKTGYITLTQPVQAVGNQTVTLNFVLSPPLETVNVVTRVVLTWDARETFPAEVPGGFVENDLDAYLYMQHTTGNLVVYYDYRGNCTDFPSACLLYDVRLGSGPETIDITALETGNPPTVYYYGVHHANYLYAGKAIPSLAELSTRVCLYSQGSAQAACYTPPEGEMQFWYLFSMDETGTATIHNCLTDTPPDIDDDPSEPDDPNDPIPPSCPSP